MLSESPFAELVLEHDAADVGAGRLRSRVLRVEHIAKKRDDEEAQTGGLDLVRHDAEVVLHRLVVGGVRL